MRIAAMFTIGIFLFSTGCTFHHKNGSFGMSTAKGANNKERIKGDNEIVERAQTDDQNHQYVEVRETNNGRTVVYDEKVVYPGGVYTRCPDGSACTPYQAQASNTPYPETFVVESDAKKLQEIEKKLNEQRERTDRLIRSVYGNTQPEASSNTEGDTEETSEESSTTGSEAQAEEGVEEPETQEQE